MQYKIFKSYLQMRSACLSFLPYQKNYVVLQDKKHLNSIHAASQVISRGHELLVKLN